MKQNVVYIAGLARSGTTFLQLRLSKNDKVVSLGEISQTINGMLADDEVKARFEWKNIENRSCSCGNTVHDCEFWGPISEFSEREIGEARLHKKIIDRFSELYENKLLVDSSKDIGALDKYYLKAGDAPKIIYITRDFRGWIPSVQKHMKRVGLRNYGYIYDAYRWGWSTFRHMRWLKKQNVDVMFVSYEKLVFDYEKNMNAIEKHLGIESGGYREERVAHDVWGSAFKNIPGADTQLKYDFNWMASSKSVFFSIFLVPIFMLNSYIYRKFN